MTDGHASPDVADGEPAPGLADGQIAAGVAHDRAVPAGSGSPLEFIEGLLERRGLYLALVAAWVATLGSLYFSEIAGFVPCQLCWYQRILMYPLTIIIPAGLLRRDRGLPHYVLPLSGLGILLSSYHYLLQLGLFDASVACSRGVPCSGRYINWLGFVTIPLLALTAFLIITFATSAARRAPKEPNLGR